MVIRAVVDTVQNLGCQAVAVANAILKAGLMGGGHVTGFRICRDLSTNIYILRNLSDKSLQVAAICLTSWATACPSWACF